MFSNAITYLRKFAKSRTIKGNVVAAAIVALLGAFGVTLEPEMVALVVMLMNFILRAITTEAISEKEIKSEK